MLLNKFSSSLILFFSLTCSVLVAQNQDINEALNPFLLNTISGGIGYKTNSFAETADKIHVKIETSGTFTEGDYTPFWMMNNNYGIASDEKGNAYIRAGVFANPDLFNGKVKSSFGLDMIGGYHLQSDVLVQQWYADFKYRSVGLSMGAKERQNPHRNMYLSSGDMTLSNNTRPVPQIEAGFPDFVTMPLTKDWLQVQGGISYGWFLDNSYKMSKSKHTGYYARNILYHRKYAYLKFEKNTPWSFILGIEMDTQWGGDMYKDGIKVADSPGSFKNLFKVFIPMAGGSDSNGTDQVNILGNVYGSYHFIFNYRLKDYTFKVYHDHFFEDHSGMTFENIPDGIYGFEVNYHKKAPVSSFLFEYIHTRNQSGPFLWDTNEHIPIQVSAGDNYYNSIDYVSETNYSLVMGNPLLISPIYNKDGSLLVRNSRITAFHGGISGYISNDLQYRALMTYSRSWGTYYEPSIRIRNQFSTMIEVGYESPKLPGWMFAGAMAYDNSRTMVGKNVGGRIKISKTFHIR